MTLSIYPTQVRADSTILPVVQSDTVDLPDSMIQIGGGRNGSWQYFTYLNEPLTFIPLNRTEEIVPVILKELVTPDLVFEGTGVGAGVGYTIQRSSGEGYDGAYTDVALNADYCSVSIKASSINLSIGVSLQDESDTVTHQYTNPTVRHSIILGQNGQGSIRENGSLVANNAFFKYEVNDHVMIELQDGIVRYYLIKADGTMRLLRQTRSKLTEPPRVEFLLYFTGSSVTKIRIFDGTYEETSYESIGVCYYRASDEQLYWQMWQNQRATQSIGEALEMADKRTQTTYANQKKRLTAYSLTPKAQSRTDFWKMQDFVNWHDTAKEFIFIDYARKDLDGNPTEIWAKFTSPFVDATRNGCQFEQQISILEDFRNDYIPRMDDATPPEIAITSVESGSAIITGTASDNVKLVSIQLYVNGVKYGDTFLPDTNGDWTVIVPSGNLTTGLNTFYAVATDYAGNQTQSNTGTLNMDTEAPTVPAGLTLSVISDTQINVSWSASSDNVAVTGYDLQRATDSGFTTGLTTYNLGNVLSKNDTGLAPSTTYYYRVRAHDAIPNNSAYSSSQNATTNEGVYDPVTAFGADCIVCLDAENISGVDGDPVTTIPNTGSENDWTKIDGTVTLAVESGKKAIHIASGGRIQGGSTTPALSAWTFYALVKSVTTGSHYFFRSFMFSGNKAIIVGFAGDIFEYYDTPRTTVGTADFDSYALVKCTVGTTAEGQWRISSDADYECYVRVVVAVNRALTGGEETDLEAWLADRQV